MKKRVGILCVDKGYEERLARYIRKNWQEEFEVATGMISCDLRIVENELFQGRTLLEAVIAEGLVEDEENLFTLSTTRCPEEKTIYRYQSAEDMMKELLYKYRRTKKEMEVDASPSHVVLFYTPGGNENQTILAKEYAQELAEQRNVLYIYFGDFSGENTLEDGRTQGDETMENQFDLSSLCYLAYCNSSKEISREKILASMRKEGKYQVLSGFRTPEHVEENTAVFVEVLEKIILLGICDILICDFSRLPVEIQKIMPYINEIHCVAPRDPQAVELYRKRLREFQGYFRRKHGLSHNVQWKERSYEGGE